MYPRSNRLTNKSSSKSTIGNYPNPKQRLPTLNLNALSACPRRGGYLKILLPRKSNFVSPSASDFADECKSDSISLPSKSKLSICSSQSSNVSTNHNVNSSDNLLALTISCVMMMASNEKQIDSKYFMFAERYLSCIKDNSGNVPPNINGILNHIKYLQREISLNRRASQRVTNVPSNNCTKPNRSESSILTNDPSFNIDANNLNIKVVVSKNYSRSRIPKRSKRIAPLESKLH